MIVRATVSNNVTRQTVMADDSLTIMEVFQQAGIDPSGCQVSANGAVVMQGNLGAKLSELGFGESVSLTAIVKRDNA